ncbi:MAG: helix-turn-helix domain-containing protein [Defluviitaleaceae bacterium]|nr:helix-turn-helix domain-containing protein [Defluviitaleaceae bacterium]
MKPTTVNFKEAVVAMPKREKQALHQYGSEIPSIASGKARRSQRQSASNFPENLTRTREELGWSIAELAGFVGISASDLGAIESGEVSPRLDLVMKLCVLMCVDVGDMVM